MYTIWHTCWPTFRTPSNYITLGTGTTCKLGSPVGCSRCSHRHLRPRCRGWLWRICRVAFWFCWGSTGRWCRHREIDRVWNGTRCWSCCTLLICLICGGFEYEVILRYFWRKRFSRFRNICCSFFLVSSFSVVRCLYYNLNFQ